MTRNYRTALEERLKDPQFRKAWEELQPEFQIIRAMIEAREEANMTQKELAEKTGIAQGDISKLETGNSNPSIRTLQRIAEGLGKKLVIEFK